MIFSSLNVNSSQPFNWCYNPTVPWRELNLNSCYLPHYVICYQMLNFHTVLYKHTVQDKLKYWDLFVNFQPNVDPNKYNQDSMRDDKVPKWISNNKECHITCVCTIQNVIYKIKFKEVSYTISIQIFFKKFPLKLSKTMAIYNKITDEVNIKSQTTIDRYNSYR